MDRAVTAVVAGILTLAAVEANESEPGLQLPDAQPGDQLVTPIQPPNVPAVRNLLLHALGRGEAGAGQLRVPIPGQDGVTYEVIITKPGIPRSVLVGEPALPDSSALAGTR